MFLNLSVITKKILGRRYRNWSRRRGKREGGRGGIGRGGGRREGEGRNQEEEEEDPGSITKMIAVMMTIA